MITLQVLHTKITKIVGVCFCSMFLACQPEKVENPVSAVCSLLPLQEFVGNDIPTLAAISGTNPDNRSAMLQPLSKFKIANLIASFVDIPELCRITPTSKENRSVYEPALYGKLDRISAEWANEG